MKHLKHILLLIAIFSLSNGKQCYAQKFADKDYYLIDSLILDELSKHDKILINRELDIYHQSNSDTIKIKALENICNKLMHDDWVKYQYFQYQLIKTALNNNPNKTVKLSLQKSLSTALNNFGMIAYNQGNISLALEYYHKSLKIDERLNNRIGIASSSNNIGYVLYRQGNVEEGISYYKKALIAHKEIGNQLGYTKALNNIGMVYYEQKEMETALDQIDDICVIGVRT